MQPVGSCRQAVEQIAAVCGGERRQQGGDQLCRLEQPVGACKEESHRHAADARFPRVLAAVAVEVFPDEITELGCGGRRAAIAEILEEIAGVLRQIKG